ncbi:hypothetical protein [Streptomyces sp. HPF1205]|uniref:hypothetical protein n=1 Tax=Streptomyces sp. HPF1205 TaxID=2873262 RepID=UPI001CECDFA9|nr:hypothetical protein [Streptomyces sp. HPF1205]
MFRETVTHASGESTGTASEAHALFLLRRAARQGYAIEATEAGGAVITWTRAGMGGRTVLRSITLTPHIPVGILTEDTVRHLGVINSRASAHYELRDKRRIIAVGLYEIPALDTARLRARALVTADDAAPVRLTLTARLGLLAQAHTAGPDGQCACGFTVHAPGIDQARIHRHRQEAAAAFVNQLGTAYTTAVAAAR